MVVRVGVSGELIAWAIRRAGLTSDVLLKRFPKLPEWERGALAPTLKQLESFAAATHTPIGMFFLRKPPDERLPLPDFRTMRNETVHLPSADLLDVIADATRRQDWYRDHVRSEGEDPVAVVGSLTTATGIEEAAATMRESLRFGPGDRGSTWSEALRILAENAEDLGVLVMISGIVGSNTHRKLDPHEFRGFAMTDAYAPVVFVNGADTKAAQIFTIAHELAS